MKCPYGCCDIKHLHKEKRLEGRLKPGKHPNVWAYDGTEYTARELADVIGLPRSVVYDRLKHHYCMKRPHRPKPGSGKAKPKKTVPVGDDSGLMASQFLALRWS